MHILVFQQYITHERMEGEGRRGWVVRGRKQRPYFTHSSVCLPVRVHWARDIFSLVDDAMRQADPVVILSERRGLEVGEESQRTREVQPSVGEFLSHPRME